MWTQKIQTWLMLFLTLVSIVTQPLGVISAHATETDTSELNQKPSENTTDSRTDEEIIRTMEESIVEEKDPENTHESSFNEHKSDENAYESAEGSGIEPEIGQPNLLESFLKANQLVQGQDGKLYTITASNYVQNSIQVLLELCGLGRSTNQIVTVPSNVHISNIDVRLSNGNREYGWYGKRVNGQVALCIEQGVALNVGDNGGYTSSEQDTALLKKISLINYYGLVLPGYSLHRELMTQLLAWEQQGITPTSISGEFDMTTYQAFKSTVMYNVNKFYTKPSFDGQMITLKVGESKTLTDSNGAFSNYENGPIMNTADVSVVKNGNKLTVTANNNSKETGQLRYMYNILQSYRGVPVVYEHPYTQNVLLNYINDPAWINLNIKILKNGNAKVKKVDADTGKALPGAKFKFTTSDGQSKELTTGSDGTASWDDLLVDTKVTIQEIQSPNGYVLNSKPQTITIKANETTTVTFDNKPQLGTITIEKLGELFGNTMPNGSYTLAGNVFEIYAGTSVSGTPVDTITTNASGQAKSKNLALGKYTIKEIQASDGFLLNPNTWTVELTYAGQNVEITNTTQEIKNKEQLADLTVIKEDEETGNKPQGAATLVGAEYTLTDASGKDAGTLTMKDVNGVVKGELKGLTLGTYTLQETKAPEGYNVDPTTYTIQLTYAGQNETVAVHSKTVTDRVIKGGIEGYKFGSETLVSRILHFFQGKDSSIKPPLEGVEIAATSHMTGKVYAAVTDKQGYFNINDLPYDTYTISETKGVEGYRLFEPFDVKIEDDGYYFHYLLEDEIIKNKLQVVKVDAETGKTIPRAGAEFKIWDTWANNQQGAWVEMTKPNSLDQTDVFATNDEGYLVTTEALPYGIDRYKLYEIKAPEGYVLLEEPIVFSVTQEDSDGMIRIEVPNRLARQDVQLIKRDRLNEQPLANVPFNLYQIEKDGSETLVDEFLTDKEGMISIEGLPYGEYKFVEGQPLPGYLELEEDIEFSVTVENDGELIVLEAVNEREDLEITTLFATVDGDKTIDPTVDNRLEDKVWIKGDAIEIGRTYTIVTEYMNRLTGEVVSRDTTQWTAKSKEDELSVFLDLPANTMEDGEEMTATHVLYYDEEQEEEVGREVDLENMDQTVHFIAPKREGELPKTGSTAGMILTVLGVITVSIVGGFYFFRKKQA